MAGDCCCCCDIGSIVFDLVEELNEVVGYIQNGTKPFRETCTIDSCACPSYPQVKLDQNQLTGAMRIRGIGSCCPGYLCTASKGFTCAVFGTEKAAGMKLWPYTMLLT